MALNSPIISLIFSGELRSSIHQQSLVLTKPDQPERELLFLISKKDLIEWIFLK